MTPFGLVVLGLLLVVADVRIDGFDVIPDVLGWLIVLAGLRPLVPRAGGFRIAMVAAVAGALVSVPQLVGEAEGLLGTAQLVIETALVFATCTGIRQVVDEEPVATAANRIRWADLALVTVGQVLGLAVSQSIRPGTIPSMEAIGALALVVLVLFLAAVAIFVWFLVLLLRLRDRPAVSWTDDVAGRRTP